jgi:hypothetical protein
LVFEVYGVTFEELQQKDLIKKPHVVILGAGASLQAFPEGDRNGSRLPLMCDLVETLELKSLLEQKGIEHEGKNFEIHYSQIAVEPSLSEVRKIIEDSIIQYLEMVPHFWTAR